MKDRDEIGVRICGVGGQGIVLAGNVLAEALRGRYEFASNSTSYGPEVRGTSVRSDIIGSNEWIDYPRVDRPNYVIALSQKVYDAGKDDFGADSRVIYDPALVGPSVRCPARHLRVEASQACMDNFGESVDANLAMLGALSALGAVSTEDLEAAVMGKMKAAEKATRAIRLGKNLVKGK